MIPFAKVESIGNDFVLVGADDVAGGDFPELARRVCARHFGVGSDGLLVVGMDQGRLILRMFNPDGTEDFCGNGIRCAALYAHDKGWLGSAGEIVHLGEAVRVEIKGARVVSYLPPASFEPERVPVCAPGELFRATLAVRERELSVSALTTGSTHAVILCEELPEEGDFFALGPAIENHPMFPDRTSVIWAKPEGESALRIRIWERGVGETLGCGTGSAAAAVVFARAQSLRGRIDVFNRGGTVAVKLDAWNGPVQSEAPARLVFPGVL